MKKIAIGLLVIILGISLVACGGEKFVWEDIVLADMLPKPPSDEGDIHQNTTEDLWMDIADLSGKQYADYVDACKEMGFTVDAETDASSFEAYNEEGYKLLLSHYGENADMSIQLEKPMEMTTIQWPTSTAGKQLPVPKSLKGSFNYEYDDNFFVYIGGTSKADYAAYVTACSEKGFNVEFSKGDDYYYADNEDGWHVSLRYEGNNIMSIDIDAPSETTDAVTTTVKTTATAAKTTEKQATGNGLRPDFKAAMDSYEKFMDEYVEFMKKYSNNPTDLSLLADYADFMKQYAEFVEDFGGWGSEDLNDAEMAYYLDVQTRVNKKLLEVAD